MLNYIIRLDKNLLFLLVGGSAALLYLTISTCLVIIFGVKEWLASSASWAICIIPAYLGQKILTFKSEISHQFAFPRYLFLQIIGILLSSILSFLLSNFTQLSTLAIFSIVISTVTIISYFFQHFLIFSTHEKQAVE